MPMRPLRGRKFADRTTALVVQAAADELAADGIEAPREATHHYLPPTKGDLAEALEDPRKMAAVAPETPRPAEMLESVAVKGDEALTGKDLALHELLVATAYETLLTSARAGYPTDVLGREMEMPMRTILAYLGPSARRSHVQRSLTALRSATVSYGLTGGRRFTNVPLLVGWGEEDDTADVVRFSLPSPVWALMAAQPRYAYLELAAMAGMRTRYGIKLYRRLALHMSRQPDWTEQTSATLVELTPEEAAAWVGYVEAPIHVGHLQTALKRAVADLEGVKKFSVQWMPPRRGHGRGAPVERFVLSVLLSPPTRHQVPAAKVTDNAIKHVGGVDAPAFRVNQHVWLKAQTLATRMKISSFATWISEAWLIALNEALTGARYSDHGYRAFRGARLLQALRDRPADDVAWDWAVEELSDPDLTVLDQNPALTPAECVHIVAEAHKARYHRYRDHAEGTGRERRVDPVKEALKEERRAARLEKQRREKADADAARSEATRDRRERFLTADIARFEVDSLDRVAAYESRLAAERSMERTWTGERFVEIQIWHRVGGQYQTECLGHYPASIADLEAIETEPDSVLKRFRPLQREARVFEGGRPSFMPKRKAPAESAAPVFAAAPPMDCAHLVDEDEEDDLSVYEGDYEVSDDMPF